VPEEFRGIKKVAGGRGDVDGFVAALDYQGVSRLVGSLVFFYRQLGDYFPFAPLEPMGESFLPSVLENLIDHPEKLETFPRLGNKAELLGTALQFEETERNTAFTRFALLPFFVGADFHSGALGVRSKLWRFHFSGLLPERGVLLKKQGNFLLLNK